MTAPQGYARLPKGVVCRCLHLWRETDGSQWCCLQGRRAAINLRREIYGRTEPHADLDCFDALGMDIIEGRA